MKCPICGEELLDAGDAEYSVECRNEKCVFGQNRQRIYGSEELFEEYTKIYKVLNYIAHERPYNCHECPGTDYLVWTAREALGLPDELPEDNEEI